MMDYDEAEELTGDDRKRNGSREDRSFIKLNGPMVIILLGVLGNIGLTIFGGAYALGEMKSEVGGLHKDYDTAMKQIGDLGSRVDNLMTALMRRSED